MDYCNFDDVKLRLNITGDDYDYQIADFVTTCSRWVDEYCRLPVDGFAVSNDSTRYFGHGDLSIQSWFSVLRLDTPLLTVTTLTNGDGAVLPTLAYRLEPRNENHYFSIRLLSGYSWSFATDGEISVLGKWGRSLVAPAPVKEATALFAAWLLKRYQAALQDATANFDLGQLTYSESVPKQVKALLTPYQNKARLVG